MCLCMDAWRCLCGERVYVLRPQLCSCVLIADLKRGGKKYHNTDIAALVCCGNLEWCHLNNLIWGFPGIVAVKSHVYCWLLQLGSLSFSSFILSDLCFVYAPVSNNSALRRSHRYVYLERMMVLKWCTRFIAQPSDDSLDVLLSLIHCRFPMFRVSQAEIQSFFLPCTKGFTEYGQGFFNAVKLLIDSCFDIVCSWQERWE